MHVTSDTGTIVKLESASTKDSDGRPAYRIKLVYRTFLLIPRGTWRLIAPDSLALAFVFNDTGETYTFRITSRDTLFGLRGRNATVALRVNQCK